MVDEGQSLVAALLIGLSGQDPGLLIGQVQYVRSG